MKLITRLSILSLLCASILPASATLLDIYTLPGSQETTIWTNLSSGNTGLAPASGTGTLGVVSPGYQASAGLYSFMGDYSITISKTGLSWDAETVILQLEVAPNPDFAWPYNGGPLLSYNGGSQGLSTADYTFVGSEFRADVFGGTTFNTYAFQWDLSTIPDSITSFSISVPISIHTSTVAVQVDAGNTYVQAVPEPSTWLLLGIGLSALVIFRARQNVRAGGCFPPSNVSRD
jgi:hypothetical protein